ncbi:Adenosylcobinamide-GDP ribazoletransferase [bioreactor metagenome]|uniref:Adenosylcobinamide-GDP ribazoletransferase n=1 Tax=bioreactor metagenome TaxID=1076179 RepID=A0A645E447_9ZZZZ|nr:adenosylcobinamide-GDP ribazoletransferase [Christensenella sp.]
MKQFVQDVLHSIATAFMMFSRVPMPRTEWKPEHMRYTLAGFPLVGVALGLLLALWWLLCRWLAFDSIFFGAGVALLPVLFTGGIHLDGFCDTVDAISSHAEPEKKKAILKDPHVGAFAVIGVASYLIADFALGTQLDGDHLSVVILFCIPVMSRAVAGYCSVSAQSSGAGLLSGMADAAAETKTKSALTACFIVTAIAMLAVSPLAGLFVTLGAGLSGWLVGRMAKKEFGGMSGDLAGYLVQVSELVMLGLLILLQRVIWIWFW